VDGLARVRHPEREQVAGHQLAGQLDRDVPKVDLGLRAGRWPPITYGRSACSGGQPPRTDAP
jgi:hypothetical protein